MTPSIFDGVTDLWWSPISDKITEDMDRAAKRALNATGLPQGVHGHAADQPCKRGLCYVLRIPARSDGGS